MSAQPIPDKPAVGKVHGKEFKVEKAIFDQNMSILKLRQGEDFSADMEFSIFIFGDDDKMDGK